jgi:SAM-dependent methyltransferase
MLDALAIAKKTVKRFVPRPRLAMRRVIYFLPDTVDLLLGRRDSMTPPRSLSFFTPREFRQLGEGSLQNLIRLGGLEPSGRVLEIGCGTGHIAAALTRYLDESGSYDGLDTVADWIAWCRGHISSQYPHFRFQLADVFNKQYNPDGKQKAADYTFPYKNESIDFVYLISVFTHMLPQDMENYFCEIARVLKKKGRCAMSFFLFNRESLELIAAGKSTLDFRYEYEKYRTVDPDVHEAAVSYDEAFVFGLYEKYGLKIRHPVDYGAWCGRSNPLSLQDIVVASKG